MKIYVAAPLGAAALVQQTQDRLVDAGHELTFDWTQDLSFMEGFETRPEKAAYMAGTMIDAVLCAEAVVVLATEHDGRGMFVELGAALAQAERGVLRSIAVVGPILHESVFYFHPRVCRYADLDDWLVTLSND